MRSPRPRGGTWSFERITGGGGRTARTVALHESEPVSVRASTARPALDIRAGFRLPQVPWRRASGYRSGGVGRASGRPRMRGGSTGHPATAGGD